MPARQHKGRYLNPDPAPVEARGWRVLKWLLTRRRPVPPPRREFTGDYPSGKLSPGNFRVTFIGHCTLIVEFAGIRILTDPVFSERASPFRHLGPRRFHPPGIPLDRLPKIDIVLVTHNHYDHLDLATIERLGDGPEYVVPKGLGHWMRRRGCKHVHELDWWDATSLAGISIVATPCQHWSKRTPFDARRSLWCGYALTAGDVRFLFIGDSGYCAVFSEIGQRLGPFTAAALPIGAYEPAFIMKDVHMTPEEALLALDDVDARIFIPTHYGCFPLTDEDPAEPPRRLYEAWLASGREMDRLWMLAPGQHRDLEHLIYIPSVQYRSPAQDSAARSPHPSLVEWGIAICPYKGSMVDIEISGSREAGGWRASKSVLHLDHVSCSSHGDLTICGSTKCPLRDPAFLRSHDLHGIRTGGAMDQFAEVDNPPEPRWWQEKLVVRRK